MALKLIKQASAYKVVLPNAGAMHDHLITVKHEDLQPQMASGSGFVEIDPHGEYTVTFSGGYAFALQYDEKIIPGSVVNAELKKRVEAFKEREGYTPGRKLQRELREIVQAELCTKALTRSKTVIGYYSTADQLLILPTISRKLKDAFMAQLVRAVESVKSTTINVSTAKGSLTTRLHGFISDQDVDAFSEFNVGDRLILIGPSGKSSFDLEELDVAKHGIKEAIAAGAQVSEIELLLSGVSFRLTQDFLLKGITFGDEAFEYDAADMDPAAIFEHEASVQLLFVSRIIETLCRMFDYTPKVSEDEDDLI